MPASKLPHLISIIVGFAVCIVITVMTGKKEAWDSELYFTIGIPFMCIAMLLISGHWPQKTWRWAFSMAIGQSIAIAMAGNSLSLWPLSIIAMTLCSIPQFITGLVTSKIVKRLGTKS